MGFVVVQGMRCPVEFLGEKDGPKYEVMAPEGYHFDDGIPTGACNVSLHSLLCFDAKERDTRPLELTLTRCAGNVDEDRAVWEERERF